MRLLDWGDTVWRIGGFSLVQLLLRSPGMLEEASAIHCDAYENGLGCKVKTAYNAAYFIAYHSQSE